MVIHEAKKDTEGDTKGKTRTDVAVASVEMGESANLRSTEFGRSGPREGRLGRIG